nr:MAG TPA: hypothetical protein [Caudoviricetes sp.]
MPVRDQCAPSPAPGGGAHRRIGAVRHPPERPDPPCNGYTCGYTNLEDFLRRRLL